jgi:hypothetical protein
MNGTRKVGRTTVALGLVAFGVALLLDNLGLYSGALNVAVRLWPAILIGFGIEYLIYTVINHQSGEDRRLRLDVGGAFLLALLVLISVGVTSFRTWVLPNLGGFSIGVGPSQSKTESKVVSASGAKALSVDVGVGEVTLNQGTSDQLKVEAEYTVRGIVVGNGYTQTLDQFKLKIAEGETITVSSDTPGSLNNASIHYTITAPKGLKVKAKTGAGRIEVTSYEGDLDLTSNVGRIDVTSGSGSLNAFSGSGHVQVQGFVGTVTARTNVGSLDMNNVTGAQQLESGTGSINVREFQGGPLVAETNSGRIDATAGAAIVGDIRLRAQTGNVNLNVPRESSIRVTASARTGSLDVPPFLSTTRTGTSSSAVGTSGDGKYTVTLEVGTGSVHFAAR